MRSCDAAPSREVAHSSCEQWRRDGQSGGRASVSARGVDFWRLLVYNTYKYLVCTLLWRIRALTTTLDNVLSPTGVLGDNVKVSKTKTKITVTTEIPMAKRYLKYLTKKFLKKHQVRDWLRVLASNTKGERNTYELKYFKLNEEDEDSEEEE
jgi:hypothetical protein